MKQREARPENQKENRFESDPGFLWRHLGPRPEQILEMLHKLGLESLEELSSKTVPNSIRTQTPLLLEAAQGEAQALAGLKKIVAENQIFKNYIGMGYSGTFVPAVIQRNILENPGWYTQYTPYQAEIAQGRLEALLNFQTMIMDLTGFEIANASLLDEATAAAEAMTMCFALKNRDASRAFWVSDDCHPQTIAVLKTRAEPLGIEVQVGNCNQFDFKGAKVFGCLLQYPATDGRVEDFRSFITSAHESDALVVMAADILALTLLTPPGELGADIAVGSTQRLGVPLGFGGPHAAYFATKDAFKRHVPGRFVGVSKDVDGKPAIRLALQTREQHIRRDKATSNICTAQVLLAVMAGMYAVYHGPRGLRRIALRVHERAALLAKQLKRLGYETGSHALFDTVRVSGEKEVLARVLAKAELRRIGFRKLGERTLCIALDETTEESDVAELVEIFADAAGRPDSLANSSTSSPIAQAESRLHPALKRTSSYLTHPVFNRYHSETEMLRYMRRLESKDLSLAHSMIPLGSCTMKLNATAEMYPLSWPELSQIHPYAPEAQTRGYRKMIQQLEKMLCEITGFSAFSLQPNAGSQGEYAGLLVIRKYHISRGEGHRSVCLIPRSAHGTNPASASMAGMQVVVVDTDRQGNVDLVDLRAKAEEHAKDLAAFMITYPSTHGVFEESIREICETIHRHGGQVYMDGANMNAQIGLCRPGEFGPDVCHLNLHKTFCIPHGGGGPGMGPIGVAAHLAGFLPGHPLIKTGGEKAIGAIAAAPWGSASILSISWMYIVMMGAEGLKLATQVSILNANYVAHRLKAHYPVLYQGKSGFVAHECIFDTRGLKETSGVEVEDIAKRLMDYGFHAPTISFPVPGTLMVEPTESESLEELDRFCEAMISIREEIAALEKGSGDRRNNVLKNAPHTAEQLARAEWAHPYTREQAVYPLMWVRERKFWPSVGRIDNVLGDRNFVCSCPPLDEYA